MPQVKQKPDDFETEAREAFDAELSLRHGTVVYEPIARHHLFDDHEMPVVYDCVNCQIDSVAESFGVPNCPIDMEADKRLLRTLYWRAKEHGLTLVLVATQLDDEDDPYIPGLVALFSDWPDSCVSIRTNTPGGSRLVHGLFSSYDLLSDLAAIILAVENLGNPNVDPNSSVEYPACA